MQTPIGPSGLRGSVLDPVLLGAVALAGLAAGIVSGLFGVGGGILMVPAAIYLVPGTTFHEAKAASLVVITFSSIIGVWTHARRRSVDFRTGLLLAAGGIAGSTLAVLAVESVADGLLRSLFGFLLMLAGLRLMRGGQPVARQLTPRTRAAVVVLLGFVGGILAGAFGIGGGILMVPGLVLGGVGIHLAVGTSLVAVLSNSLVSTLTHLGVGYGPGLAALGIPLAIGAVPGARLGSVWAHRLKAPRLQLVFGGFLALVGVMMSIESAVLRT